MAVRPDRRILEELRRKAREIHPEVLLGWDLHLSETMSDEVDLVIDAFLLPNEKRREFFHGMFGPLRDAEKRLGRFLTVVAHTPEASRLHYADALRRLEEESSREEPPSARPFPRWIFEGLPGGSLRDAEVSPDSPHIRAA